LTTQLENETSLILVPYSQSLKNIGTPTKSFEKAVLDGVIVDPNPIMKWMVTNVFIKPDVNGNYKPLKETRSGTKRIDGVITSIMAFDRLNANSNVEKEYSFADIMSSF
jgi:phage terminase large subunit-like protein